MYVKSAQFFDALYRSKDYASAVKKLHSLLLQIKPDAKSLLDIACGTGNHLGYLREHYQCEGLDINPDLLTIARKKCPEVTFHQGDMVDFKLTGKFDIVTCLFSSISYVKTADNLTRTLASMVRHLHPGGIIVIEPWLKPEKYWTDRLVANFVDEPELKISWMYIGRLEGKIVISDVNYLVGTPQSIQHFTERHEMGLFTHEEYLEAFRESGIQVQYDSEGLFGYGIYIGVHDTIK
jgi:ubiquinone/menaquinone biosynthesis C-methylase UbiE